LLCWEELNKAERTAALLALSIEIRRVPAALEARIMRRAERKRAGPTREGRRLLPRLRLRLSWPVLAGGVGALGLAALIFAAALQVQLNDLKDENGDLQSQLASASTQLTQTNDQVQQTKAIFSVLSDPEVKTLPVSATSFDTKASAYYSWSADTGKGFVVCEDMPRLPPGKVYEVWVATARRDYPLTSFETSDGTCAVPMDLSFLHERPEGMGLSVENYPTSMGDAPTGGWFLYGHFPGQ
jgi:hypothetical protein